MDFFEGIIHYFFDLHKIYKLFFKMCHKIKINLPLYIEELKFCIKKIYKFNENSGKSLKNMVIFHKKQ